MTDLAEIEHVIGPVQPHALPTVRRIANGIPIPARTTRTRPADDIRDAGRLLGRIIDHIARLLDDLDNIRPEPVECPATNCRTDLAVLPEHQQLNHWHSHGILTRWAAHARKTRT